jgi:hypothetical protein
MDDADYWIIKLARPDRVLLTPRQIKGMNQKSLERGLVNDVFSEKLWSNQAKSIEHQDEEGNNGGNALVPAPVSARLGYLNNATLLFYLKEETERIKKISRWDSKGRLVEAAGYQVLDDQLNLSGVGPENLVRFGLTRRRTDFRYYPTREALKTKPVAWEFDCLQVSAVQANQPVAILHASRDGLWVFAIAPACRGWVPAADIAVCAQLEELKPFLEPARRLVIVGHAVKAVAAPGDTLAAEFFYMGTSCPLLGADSDYYQIALPDTDAQGRWSRRTAYISRQAEVHEGFLPCTPRNIIVEAFRLLHSPYSWGGQGEFRDCSQLVMDVYATFGLVLPRNSGYQGQVGNRILRWTRKHKVAYRQEQLNRLAAPALLQFPGHIMLYLGREGGHYYAIHDIWSFRRPDTPSRDQKIIIGKVVVSDLSLGESSTRGSLLERITTVNQLKP